MRQEITSRKNPIIKNAAALAGSAEKRKETGLFLCEGARLCYDAAVSDVSVKIVFATETALQKYAEYIQTIEEQAGEFYLIPDSVASLLSQTKNTQGVFCVCSAPSFESESLDGKMLVLENIQDPANLGTILRTAEAFGVNQVVLLGSRQDPCSPKVLRASMGAVFRQHIIMAEDVSAFFTELEKMHIETYAAIPVPEGILLGQCEFPENAAVFIGNEGNGLEEETIQKCRKKLTIPMRGRAESLNAAAAASILLWELTKK
jgi:rRNA methylases